MTAREVVVEVVRRFHAGEPIDEFFAPGYRPATTSPGVVAGLEPAGTPDEQVRQFVRAGVEIQVRSVTDAPGERFVLENVWIHGRGGGTGSSGIFWSVMSVEHDLITTERHFERRADAYAFAGLQPGAASA